MQNFEFLKKRCIFFDLIFIKVSIFNTSDGKRSLPVLFTNPCRVFKRDLIAVSLNNLLGTNTVTTATPRGKKERKKKKKKKKRLGMKNILMHR